MAGFSIQFHASAPDDIPVAMTITMTLGEWKRMQDQLSGPSFPAWRLRDAVRDMVARAEKHFLLQSDPPVDPR
ncbi:MAG: hypothetical protein M0Z99_32235 [Betaproteobacteria bacterium]|nr:hypothetical protein [Betaproteobacteria bacterium]